MRKKVRLFALLLTPLIILTLALAHLKSWRVQVVKTAGDDPFQVTFSSDGKYLAVAAHSFKANVLNGALDAWRVDSPGFLRPLRLSNHRLVRVYCPASVCFSSDSTRLICTSYKRDGDPDGGHITSWHPATGKQINTLVTENTTQRFVQTWPDKDTLAYWTDNKVEQRISGQKADKTKVSHDDLASQYGPGRSELVAFAPNGKLLAWTSSSYESKTRVGVQIRPLHNKHSLLLPFDGCSDSNVACMPTALAFSPESQRIVVSLYRGDASNSAPKETWKTLLWDVSSRHVVSQWSETSDVNAFAFAPDGRMVAEAHQDGYIHLHALPSGKLHRSFKAHVPATASVAFSPDGTLLASCGGDSTLRLTRVH